MLESVITAYKNALPAGDSSAFAVDALDRLGVPVRIVPFRTPEGLLFDGFGYGATPDEALVGALGELSEHVHGEMAMRTIAREVGSYVQMLNRYGARGVADPLTLCLPAGSRYMPELPLTWVPAKRYPTNERVWLPVEFAAVYKFQLRGVDPLITPISNGLGAGLSYERAVGHGLLELLQRDGNVTSFRALDRGIVVDCDSGLDAATATLLARLRGEGLAVTVKLAATEFGIASVYVVGDDPEPAFPMALTACGEAAHPHVGTAIRKAMLEFAAARSRKRFMHGPLEGVRQVAPAGYLEALLADLRVEAEEPRCLAAMVDWLSKSATELRQLLAPTVFSERSRVLFSELPSVPLESVSDPIDRCQVVADRLIAAGCDILVVDASPRDTGVFAVKIVATNIECETMSYYRIGERGAQRSLERGDDFVGRGEPPMGARTVRLTAAATERLGGPVWLNTGRIDELVGELYPLYREPSSHAGPVRLAQLREGI